MVLFASLLDQFVSSFDRAYGLSILQNLVKFDSLTFQQKIFINGFNGLGILVLSLILKIQDQDYVGVGAIIVSKLSFESSCSI